MAQCIASSFPFLSGRKWTTCRLVIGFISFYFAVWCLWPAWWIQCPNHCLDWIMPPPPTVLSGRSVFANPKEEVDDANRKSSTIHDQIYINYKKEKNGRVFIFCQLEDNGRERKNLKLLNSLSNCSGSIVWSVFVGLILGYLVVDQCTLPHYSSTVWTLSAGDIVVKSQQQTERLTCAV